MRIKVLSCFQGVEKGCIDPFLANVPILYPLKHQKTFGFLVFSGGIKWEHWPEMDKEQIEIINQLTDYQIII